MNEQDQTAVRRIRRQRAVVALGVGVAAVAAVAGFRTVGPSAAEQDQSFVRSVEQQGKVVPTGEQQALLISAAHKICDRQGSGSSTTLARRQTALQPEEIDAVEHTFGDDTRGFVELALNTYCAD
jgi:hypothetical protein